MIAININKLNPSEIFNKKISSISLLILAFFMAVLLRITIGGHDVAHSSLAGLVFGLSLLGLAYAAKLSTKFSIKALAWGLIGVFVLYIPVVIWFITAGHIHNQPAGNFASWTLIVSLVAITEEAFLRGVLYDAIKHWKGDVLAIAVGAILFAALHLPLYGWHVLPLDLVVGIWLGMLRWVSKSWIAPAITHSLTDLLGWWFI